MTRRIVREVGRHVSLASLHKDEILETRNGYFVAREGGRLDELAKNEELEWRKSGWMPMSPFTFRVGMRGDSFDIRLCCIYGLVIYRGKKKAGSGYFGDATKGQTP